MRKSTVQKILACFSLMGAGTVNAATIIIAANPQFSDAVEMVEAISRPTIAEAEAYAKSLNPGAYRNMKIVGRCPQGGWKAFTWVNPAFSSGGRLDGFKGAGICGAKSKEEAEAAVLKRCNEKSSQACTAYPSFQIQSFNDTAN